MIPSDSPPSSRQAEPFPEAAARAKEYLRHPDLILCSCHGIPAETVATVIRRSNTRRVADVSRVCTAGTGCATCRPDIAALIREITGEEPDWTLDEGPMLGGEWV